MRVAVTANRNLTARDRATIGARCADLCTLDPAEVIVGGARGGDTETLVAVARHRSPATALVVIVPGTLAEQPREAAVEWERAAWLAGAEAAREEAAETCDAWALLYHPTLRSTIAASLAARIRALPPAAPPPPREGAVRAPDGGGTGEGSPDAPEGATGALAGEGRL